MVAQLRQGQVLQAQRRHELLRRLFYSELGAKLGTGEIVVYDVYSREGEKDDDDPSSPFDNLTKETERRLRGSK